MVKKKQSVEDYMGKGLDRTMAEYFASGMKRVVAVEPNPDYTLTLTFDNGEKRQFDCNPLLKPGTVFESFMQWEHFRRVYVDKTGGCVAWDIDPNVDSEVEWGNKVDLCPDSCYVNSKPMEEEMREEYDFSNGRKNPYIQRLK